jgi:hypothetical protein
LIDIAERAREAGPQDLAALDAELHRTVADLVETGAAEQRSAAALAASHARATINARGAEARALRQIREYASEQSGGNP